MKKENLPAETQKTNLPADIIDNDFLQMCQERSGMENIDSRDIKIPYVNLIQSLSPQRRSSHETYIEGCKEGDIVISSTKEIKKELNFIFCASEKSFPEYAVDNKGIKTFVDRHKDESILETCRKGDVDKGEKKGYYTTSGTEIIPTRTCYILIINDDGSLTKAIVNLKKTALTSWKELATLMANQKIKVGDKIVNPPAFSCIYKMESKLKTGDHDFYVYKFTDMKQFVSKEQFAIAKSFYEDFKRNSLQVSDDSFSEEGTSHDVSSIL